MKYIRTFWLFLVSSGLLFGAPNIQAETFEEALVSVYRSNPSLKAARAQVREVDESYIQARAEGRLNANLSASIDYAANRASGEIVPGLPDQTFSREGFPLAAQVQVIQPLYQGGRVRALKGQAKASILAAREQLRGTEQELLQQSANAYANVLRDEEAARIRRSNVSVLARQEMAAQLRFDVGAGTKTDIAQAQSRVAAAEAGLAAAEAQLQSSRATYIRFVGHIPVDLQPIPRFELPPTLETAILRARENNPSLLAAAHNRTAAKSAIDVAKSASKPVVSLNGTLGGQRGQINGLSEGDQFTIGAQFVMPLFSGGANKSRVRQARHADSRLEFEIKDLERALDEGVRQTWAQLDAARLTLKATRLQVQAAKIAFEGVELEQSVGTRTTLDVLDAEQELLNSKLSQIDAEKDLNIATFQLLTVLGVFDAEGIRLPLERYDSSENLKAEKNDSLKRLTKSLLPKK